MHFFNLTAKIALSQPITKKFKTFHYCAMTYLYSQDVNFTEALDATSSLIKYDSTHLIQ